MANPVVCDEGSYSQSISINDPLPDIQNRIYYHTAGNDFYSFKNCGTLEFVNGDALSSTSEPEPTTGFDPATLDPSMIAGSVGVGFFILAPLWAASFGVRALIRTIRV